MEGDVRGGRKEIYGKELERMGEMGGGIGEVEFCVVIVWGI
jgi:hypothetical protein